MGKYTANHIVNFFIEKPSLYIDNIKANKLAYISYGFYSAFFDEKLFDDTIEAWKLGPVIPTVYHSLKKFRYERITKPYKHVYFEERPIPKIDSSDKDTIKIVGSVANIYGNLPPDELIYRTHKKGTYVYPNCEIAHSLIQQYYKKLLLDK